jgi:Transposase, Mutator family
VPDQGRDALLAFYDFPAEHWKHLRTTNVIESSLGDHPPARWRSKGCLSNKTALAIIFKLAEAAERSWRRLDGRNQLPKLILGVKFGDGARSSERKLKLPPEPFRRQDSAIAPSITGPAKTVSRLHRDRKFSVCSERKRPSLREARDECCR